MSSLKFAGRRFAASYTGRRHAPTYISKCAPSLNLRYACHDIVNNAESKVTLSKWMYEENEADFMYDRVPI